MVCKYHKHKYILNRMMGRQWAIVEGMAPNPYIDQSVAHQREENEEKKECTKTTLDVLRKRVRNQGNSVEQNDKDRFDALCYALKKGRVKDVSYFIKLVKAESIRNMKDPLIFLASKNLDYESSIVAYLFNHGYCDDVNEKNSHGMSRLMQICELTKHCTCPEYQRRDYREYSLYWKRHVRIADILLEYDRDSRSDLDFMVNLFKIAENSKSREILMSILKRMALLASTGSSDKRMEVVSDLVKQSDNIKDMIYYESCLKELKDMRNTIIPYSSLSYFDILTGAFRPEVRKCIVVKYFLLNRKRQRDLLAKFPKYYYLMLAKYNYMKCRWRYLNNAHRRLNNSYPFFQGIPHVRSQILEYLSNKELKEMSVNLRNVEDKVEELSPN
ncbi:hypothetical protein QAD02_001047 [Eretmocerus hayati]|uniref:Uncharacterized protein n=1 Tax=Eretmocerus hayati TaxID=131215 RepID=A0ACC2NF45_9HYME|nr:hypothetical protein QAD02_001047 [Eretmocerus hayati]